MKISVYSNDQTCSSAIDVMWVNTLSIFCTHATTDSNQGCAAMKTCWNLCCNVTEFGKNLFSEDI